jgi:ankyrin repeat protein
MMATDLDFEKVQNLCHAIQRRNNWEEVESLLNSFPVVPIPNVYLWNRRTVLHVIAKAGPPAYILRQILRMIDIDFCCQPDNSGNTPLALICSSLGRDLDAIRLLALDRPQDFFRPSQYGRSLCGFFVSNPNRQSPCDKLMRRQSRFGPGFDEVEIAQIIADAAEAWPDGVLHVPKNGGALLQRAIPFSYSVNDFILIRTILAIQPESIEMTDSLGHCAIHDAAFAGADDDDGVKRLKLLLECGGSRALSRKQDTMGQTPLHVACFQFPFSRDIAMMLVANQPSALNVRDKYGMTPLERLRLNSDELRLNGAIARVKDYTGLDWDENLNKLADTVITMLTGAPVYCSDSPSLHELLHNQECTPDIAKLLIYALRDQTSLKDGNGNLPLHIVASMYSDHDIVYVKAILETLLHLPLHIIASMYSDNDYGKAIEALLEVYPAACQISNSEGTLPLQLMDRSGKSWSNGMRRVLLQHPAAVLDLELNCVAICALLAKLGSEEKPDALFRLLKDVPVFARRANIDQSQWADLQSNTCSIL